MHADGEIHQRELILIAAVCMREGISKKDMDQCLNLNGHKFKFFSSNGLLYPPKKKKTAIKYISDAIALVTCDGEITAEEILLCNYYARQMNLDDSIVDLLLRQSNR